jgi:hypothetical protein
MGTLFVFLDLPVSDFLLRIEQVLKPAHRQALIPQPPMETLDARILRRLSRLKCASTRSSLHAPRQKMPTGQFRPVVATDRQRLPTLRHDRLQRFIAN